MITGPLLFLLGPIESRMAVGIATATMSLLVLLRLAGLVRLLEFDVAGRRVLEAKLTHQALHDPVTGLANRRQFVAQAEAALAARLEPGSIAALFIDLDDFKSINDDFGHAAGDEALMMVAQRIRGALRDGDLAARLGGDEFGVLVLGLTGRDAMTVGDRIMAELARPLELSSGRVLVGASIGTAIDGPGDGGVDELLGNADVAMYRAKGLGTGRHQIFASGRPAAPRKVRRPVRAVRAGSLPAGTRSDTVAASAAESSLNDRAFLRSVG
jgi:diguanylate cyclase (GGDEF)-like protein